MSGYCEQCGNTICICDEAAKAPKCAPYGYFRYDIRLDAWVQNKESTQGVAFYTAPPKREWVGLTEEEVAECWTTNAVQTWKNIEAKLREKNT